MNGLRVVNYVADRGKNESKTKDEKQRQFLLQIISEYRHIFPDSSKATISNLISNCKY